MILTVVRNRLGEVEPKSQVSELEINGRSDTSDTLGVQFMNSGSSWDSLLFELVGRELVAACPS